MRLKLILLAAVLFVVSPAVHAQQELGPNYTIGYGGAFQKTQNEGWEDVLRRCLMQYGRAEWMPGIYQFDEAMVGSFSGARITGSKLTVLKPATSGSVGLFNFTGGSNITLEGFTVKATTFTTAQSWIRFSSGVSYTKDGTIAVTSATTLTDSANGFLTAGLLPGMLVTIRGFTGSGVDSLQNSGNFTITALTAGLMTVTGPTLTADAATGGEVVTIAESTGGKNITVDDCVLWAAWSTQPTQASQAVTPVGTATDADCVKMLDVIRTSDMKVTNCTFLPDYGAKPISATDGNGMLILGNRFGNNIEAGLGNFADLATNIPRLSNIVIEWNRMEWSQIVANKFWAIGTGNDATSGNYWDNFYEVPHIIKIVGSLNGSFTSETGHNVIANNIMEYNCTPKQVAIYGCPSTSVSGNIFGLIVAEADCGPNAIGEGALIFADGDGAGSGTDICQGANVFGNDFHNNGFGSADISVTPASRAACIHAQSTSDLKVSGNTFAVVGSQFAIELASSCESPSITGNAFRGSGTSYAPIHLNSGGSISNGVMISSNDSEGFVNALSSDNPGAGTTTGSGSGTAGVDDFMGTVAATATTITRTAGSFILDGWQPGDYFTAAGLDTAGDNSRVIRVVTVATLTLTVALPGNGVLTADVDNGTDVVLTEYASTIVANDSTTTVDYYLEGLSNSNGEAWISNTTTGTLTNITIATNSFTRAAGSFITDGFKIGDLVTMVGSPATAGDAGKAHYVINMSATVLTLAGATLTADGTAGESVAIVKIGGMPNTNVSLD